MANERSFSLKLEALSKTTEYNKNINIMKFFKVLKIVYEATVNDKSKKIPLSNKLIKVFIQNSLKKYSSYPDLKTLLFEFQLCLLLKKRLSKIPLDFVQNLEKMLSQNFFLNSHEEQKLELEAFKNSNLVTQYRDEAYAFIKNLITSNYNIRSLRNNIENLRKDNPNYSNSKVSDLLDQTVNMYQQEIDSGFTWLILDNKLNKDFFIKINQLSSQDPNLNTIFFQFQLCLLLKNPLYTISETFEAGLKSFLSKDFFIKSPTDRQEELNNLRSNKCFLQFLGKHPEEKKLFFKASFNFDHHQLSQFFKEPPPAIKIPRLDFTKVNRLKYK
jgi:hypothetical protein